MAKVIIACADPEKDEEDPYELVQKMVRDLD